MYDDSSDSVLKYVCGDSASSGVRSMKSSLQAACVSASASSRSWPPVCSVFIVIDILMYDSECEIGAEGIGPLHRILGAVALGVRDHEELRIDRNVQVRVQAEVLAAHVDVDSVDPVAR